VQGFFSEQPSRDLDLIFEYFEYKGCDAFVINEGTVHFLTGKVLME